MTNKKLILIIISIIIVVIILIGSITIYYNYQNNLSSNNTLENNTIKNASPTPTTFLGPLKILNNIKTESTIIGNTFSVFVHTSKPIKLTQDTQFARLINVSENKYVIELLQLIEGENEIKVSLIDDDGNKESFNFKINRKAGSTIKDWNNFKYTDETKDLLMVVDKKNKLTSSYEPNDLVDLGATPYGLYVNVSNLKLRKEAADALKKMLTDYNKEYKEHLVISSAYRSYNDQYNLHSYWVSELGATEAEKISAKPGYSEHQLGTVVDFINKDSNYQLTEKFAETKSYQWLINNAHNYGFVLSYPKDKESITGYKFEPWHWRYIGVDNAIEFKSQNEMTLNQWLEMKTKNLD